MKQVFQKKKWMVCSVAALLFLMSLCCFGCAPDPSDTPGQGTEAKPGGEVFVVSGSSRTTNEWEMQYGAIKADGTMVLPIQYQQIVIVEDRVTGEPLWLQTYEVVLKDGIIATQDMSEQMLQDYYEDLYQNKSEYFEQQYTLYDLDGNLVEVLGSKGVRFVYGDLIVYQDNQLVHRESGEVLFEDVITLDWAEDCYIIGYDQYNRVCVMDKNLNVLLDREGNEGFTGVDGHYYVVTKENGKSGLCRIDGTQIVPSEYDYMISYNSLYAPYVQARKGEQIFVISLADGKTVYQTADEYDYVQEMFPDFMVIQKRTETTEEQGRKIYQYQSQLYDYDGNPIGEAYKSMTPETDLYNSTRNETGEGVLLFNVTDFDDKQYLINADGNVRYNIAENSWATALTADRVIENRGATEEAGIKGYLRKMDGTALNEKEYETIYQLYLPMKNNRYELSELMAGYYTYNRIGLQDVMDADGNVLLEQLKAVSILSEDRFWVEKGFSQGLMDRNGNWLYEQSLFDGAVDE